MSVILSNIVEQATNAVAQILFANVLFFIPNANLPFLIFWVMLACIYFTIKLDFVNFKYFTKSFKIFLEKEKLDKSGKTITSRSAFLGAISGCVGVGSVSGVAASVYYGGPGVVLWLLIAAFCAMPVRFAEVYLGHHFRTKDESGNIISYGPFAYIKNGFTNKIFIKIFTFLFAFSLILVSFSAIMGQVRPTTELISYSLFGGNVFASSGVAALLGVLTLVVIFGGLKRISRTIEKLTIVMSFFYIVSILSVFIFYFKNIPDTIVLIFNSAFEVKSVYGGDAGTAIIAFTRIIAMNEIGMGTVAILHGKSKNENSAKEACLAMAGPFVAIFIFVALNGFAVVLSGSHASGNNGVIMINHMFAGISKILPMLLIVVVFLFSITTLIAWYFYVETALEEIKGGKILIKLYPIFFMIIVMSASLLPFGTILKFTDVFGISIIIPNIIILYLLSGKVKIGLEKYKKNLKS